MVLLIGVVGHTCGKENQTMCDQLTCMRADHGRIVHYDIYERPAWIGLTVWICAREITKCGFYENFIGETSTTCHTHFETLSRESCLLLGTTRNSMDGPLTKLAQNMYGTNNAIKAQYAWLSTKIDVKANTFLTIDSVQTDGAKVETTHPTLEACSYEKGACALKNKTMAWETPCFYNLVFQRSEICHHKGKEVYCSDSDFDEIGNATICDIAYIRTKQASYLSVNISGARQTVKEHRLNAAVIQHLLDNIDELKRSIQCMAQNAMCSRVNETVTLRHHVEYAFNASHRVLHMRDSDLNELILERINELQSSGQTDILAGSRASWLSLWFAKLHNVVLTVIGFVVFCALLAWMLPHVGRYLWAGVSRCTRRTRRAAPHISTPMEMTELPEQHPLRRYRTYSVREPLRRPSS